MREPEPLIIRPPTEAGSLLICVTRGCNWNRCRFCGIYPHFGRPEHEPRPLDDVLADIHAARDLHGDVWETAFLGDADPMSVPPDDFSPILRELRAAFSRLVRVTCYARAATCWLRKRRLGEFKDAGLDRVHVGLETGADELLRFHDKGVSQGVLIKSGRQVRQAGLELSHYVLLGLGGADRSDMHVRETLEVLNAVRPDFVRFRRLWIYGSEGGPACPLWHDVRAGRFTPQSPEGTVLEMRAIIAGINFPTHVEAIHGNVYVRLQGELPGAREKLLAKMDRFLAKPAEDKAARYARPSAI